MPLVAALAMALAVQPYVGMAQEPATARAAPSRAVRPPLTPEQLKALVEQLSANEFLARETATIELAAAGGAAIPAVSAALTGTSLEATSRALHVLLQLGLSPDLTTQEAARQALIQAASQRENPSVARRAAGVLAQLLELRSTQALTELEGLGAKVVRSQSFNGVAVEEIIESVEIGADFRGSVADLARLKWLSAIKLVLVGDRVHDDWLKHASAMTAARELHLYRAAVSDEGLTAIAEHPSIQQLGIYYTPVSGKALAHFEKLPRLSFLKLYGTKVERADVEAFLKTTGLPNDKVDHRKGAFLGVGCMTIENTCILSTVHAGSPAEKAGLQRDDVLLNFNGTKIVDFPTLTGLISQLDSGDEAQVEVQREVEDEQGNIRTRKVTVKATLAPWDVELAVENGVRP
ncbi:MAG: PDZ domain-containing protein [Planctomycetaceae bacterium]|nr:PDZ domain-containing protein [Planctomycetaceae bacterium]